VLSDDLLWFELRSFSLNVYYVANVFSCANSRHLLIVTVGIALRREHPVP
jgi:hypothetical protein